MRSLEHSMIVRFCFASDRRGVVPAMADKEFEGTILYSLGGSRQRGNSMGWLQCTKLNSCRNTNLLCLASFL